MANGNTKKWSAENIQFLKDNFFKLTNLQLSQSVDKTLTVTRNKCAELGLKRIEMEYWTEEQIQYLKDNYHTKGDVEIAEIFEVKWPKNKKWRKQHIRKKRGYLKLHRSEEEIFVIASNNSRPGGNSYTIDKNSSSINMHPSWLVQRMAWRDKELQQEILAKHPDLIELQRQLIILKREIKKHDK